jgi:hypothetical protein
MSEKLIFILMSEKLIFIVVLVVLKHGCGKSMKSMSAFQKCNVIV